MLYEQKRTQNTGIGYVLSFEIPESGITGVWDMYNGKKVYLVDGEHSWESTTNVMEAAKFESKEDIFSLRFKDVLMVSGEVHRSTGLYGILGLDMEEEKFLTIEKIDFSPTILEQQDISENCIRVPVSKDPEFEEFQRLSKKFL
jgi:hypothetical protein